MDAHCVLVADIADRQVHQLSEAGVSGSNPDPRKRLGHEHGHDTWWVLQPLWPFMVRHISGTSTGIRFISRRWEIVGLIEMSHFDSHSLCTNMLVLFYLFVSSFWCMYYTSFLYNDHVESTWGKPVLRTSSECLLHIFFCICKKLCEEITDIPSQLCQGVSTVYVSKLFHTPEQVCSTVLHVCDSLSSCLEHPCATMHVRGWPSEQSMSVPHVSRLFLLQFRACLFHYHTCVWLFVLLPRTYLSHHICVWLSNKTAYLFHLCLVFFSHSSQHVCCTFLHLSDILSYCLELTCATTHVCQWCSWVAELRKFC